MAVLAGKQFIPHLISGPFHHGLVIVFSTAITVLVIAVFASLLRGRRYVHNEQGGTSVTEDTAVGPAAELAIEVAAEEETAP